MNLSIFSHPATLSVIVALPLFGVIAKIFGTSFQRIAKWYLYIAVFAVLMVATSIFFPFIGGKDYFFRYAVELSLMALVLWWAFEAKFGEAKQLITTAGKKPLFVAVSIFAVVFLLACAFAYDPHAAFWSNYERGEGGFQLIHYYLFFALSVLLLKKEEEWKNIFKFSLIAAGGMILYGIAGNYMVPGTIGPYAGGSPPATWWHKLIDGRFQGSLGNPAYVAPYLIFSIFYAAYLWLAAKTAGKLTKWKTAGYAALIIIFSVFFVLSQTRGAFLGLAVGVFALVLYVVFSGAKTVRKWGSIVLLVLVLLGVGLYSVRNVPFVQNLPEGRLLQISTSDTTAQTRFWVWGEAWKGFLDKPVLGWGPENFSTVYDKYFDPRFFVPGVAGETWFDRAHSVFFDYLSETGILGLLSYLSIFAIFYWEFFRKHRRIEAHSVERGLVFALPVAYLVQGIAIFDVLPMYISLFLFMAFANYYFYEKHGQ